MSDRQAVLLAVAVAVGAFAARPLPVAAVTAAVFAIAAALVLARPLLLVAGAAVLASALGASAMAGLRPPTAQPVEGRWVTLLTDPAPNAFGSIGADVRIGRRHAQAFARGSAGSALAPRLAGEKVRVSGRLEPLTGRFASYLVPRHIAARLSVDAVTGVKPANPVGAFANGYRRIVARGAEVLPEHLRPLFGGMVLGDDRGQSVELQHAFRAAGLTHLMVVSGQNVAFALLVAAPLIRRGRLWWRFAVTLGVLFAFGTLTRWEPSVLRAEAMAAVAAAGALSGRPVPALRLLALAVAGCVLIDPLLVRSIGFRLSVAACSGLVLFTGPLQRRRFPTVLAASVAAQAGAAVVLVPTFGTVPLVSLIANVLAVPVAGPLMMWGLTAGPLAGLVAFVAPLLHLPTRLALSWEAAVATQSAALPIAPVGLAGAVAVAVGGGALLMAQRAGRWRRPAAAAGVVVLGAVVAMAVRGPAPVSGLAIDPGVTLWVRDGRSVVVVGGRASSRALDALRSRRVHRLDVLVVTKPGSAAANAAWPFIAAFRPRVVLAPEHHQVAGAHTARLGAAATVGGVRVRVTGAGPPLRVRVGAAVYGRGRDPPSRRPARRRHASQPRHGHPQPHARLLLRPR